MTRETVLLLSTASGLLALAVDAERYVDIADDGAVFAVIYRGDDAHPGVRVFLNGDVWTAVDQTDERVLGYDSSVTSLLSTPRVVRAIRATLETPFEWLPMVEAAEALLELAEEMDRAPPAVRRAEAPSVSLDSTPIH